MPGNRLVETSVTTTPRCSSGTANPSRRSSTGSGTPPPPKPSIPTHTCGRTPRTAPGRQSTPSWAPLVRQARSGGPTGRQAVSTAHHAKTVRRDSARTAEPAADKRHVRWPRACIPHDPSWSPSDRSRIPCA